MQAGYPHSGARQRIVENTERWQRRRHQRRRETVRHSSSPRSDEGKEDGSVRGYAKLVVLDV
jgi:hypothetical protein